VDAVITPFGIDRYLPPKPPPDLVGEGQGRELEKVCFFGGRNSTELYQRFLDLVGRPMNEAATTLRAMREAAKTIERAATPVTGNVALTTDTVDRASALVDRLLEGSAGRDIPVGTVDVVRFALKQARDTDLTVTKRRWHLANAASEIAFWEDISPLQAQRGCRCSAGRLQGTRRLGEEDTPDG